MKFVHHFIDTELPVYNGYGDYGQTALVDVDRDGDLDFVVGRGATQGKPSVLYWYENQGNGKWQRHILGRDSQSDVGATALDVDGDGWVDLVCDGVWYRNTGKPREQEFVRYVYDAGGTKAHDLLAADVDGDGKAEIITLRSGKDGVRWHKIANDPTQAWERHIIGNGIHGAIAPWGVGDIAGHGHLDIVSGDTWFENKDGKGMQWVAHKNIPFGRVGPFGMCVRCAVVDIDGDGKKEVVMLDCDIVESKGTILRNVNGDGSKWERNDLPQSFKYGSLHSLAVMDMNGDGRLDIVTNEQEELLPEGRQNPRWIVWENLGGGKFAERIILDGKLGGHELLVGDLNGDGKPDVISKAWGPLKWNAVEGKMHVDWLENIGR
jgi:hypothetical protein